MDDNLTKTRNLILKTLVFFLIPLIQRSLYLIERLIVGLMRKIDKLAFSLGYELITTNNSTKKTQLGRSLNCEDESI